VANLAGVQVRDSQEVLAPEFHNATFLACGVKVGLGCRFSRE
jgi:hypothetical protein